MRQGIIEGVVRQVQYSHLSILIAERRAESYKLVGSSPSAQHRSHISLIGL